MLRSNSPRGASRAAMSVLPSWSEGMVTTSKPHMAAVAGFVPWAESGMSTRRRPVSPRSSRYALILTMPESSAWAPAAGGRRLELVEDGEGSLHGGLGLERVGEGEAGQAGDVLVHLGVVLHRAGAEGVEAGIDAVVEAAEPPGGAHDPVL